MKKAGRRVILVDRWREHVDAINRDGLRIDGVRGSMTVPLEARTRAELEGPLGFVFIATKSSDTAEAVRQIAPFLTTGSVVVSMQNGLNEDVIAECIGPERVIGAVPEYGAALLGPGHIEFTHEAPVHVGELDGQITYRLLRTHELVSNVTTCYLSEDIRGRVWAKQVLMTEIVMTGLVDATMHEALASVRNRFMGIALVREALAVADAHRVQIPSDRFFYPSLYRSRDPEKIALNLFLIDQHMRLVGQERRHETSYRFEKRGSGIWWDLVRRRRATETYWLTGEIVRRAQRIGVPTPLNARCAEMIYEIERGERAVGWTNLDELAAFMRECGESLVAPPQLQLSDSVA